MIGPYVELEKPAQAPETGWESYLAKKWGTGSYWVFCFSGGRGKGFKTVFKGDIGWF